MLVFSAAAGEVIDIGDEIRVRVIATESDRVRLGVEAPAEHDAAIELSRTNGQTGDESSSD